MGFKSHKISCPHCGHSKKLPKGKLPKRRVGATCPKCDQRFVFDPNFSEHKRGFRETELFKFYSTTLHAQKGNAFLIIFVFLMYGTMYMSITSAYYLYIRKNHGYAGDMLDFIQGALTYIMFFPVVVMHSWDYITHDSQHIVDRLHSHNFIFFLVTISYILCFLVISMFFEHKEMPLALILPVMLSSLVPSILHVYRNRHDQGFFQ